MKRSEYLIKIGKIINSIKRLGKLYYKETKRPLGITGEVAEYEAVRLMKIHPSIARQPGYDAIRRIKTPKGIREERIQIKGRVVHEHSKNGQKLGAINLEKEWDATVLVVLDSDFNPIAIYEAKRRKIKEALQKPGSKARNLRGQLSFSKFKNIGKLIWKDGAKSHKL